MRRKINVFACLILLAIVTEVSAGIVGNRWIQRELAVRDGDLVTTRIVNGVSTESLTVKGDEFKVNVEGIGVLSSRDFRVTREPEENKKPLEKAEWTLVSDGCQLKAVIRYLADEKGEPLLRKQITFTNLSDKSRTIRWIDLECLKVHDESISYTANPAFPTLTDYGQPVFLDSIWLGIEHPAANCAAGDGGLVTLRHHPGRKLAPAESLNSKVAIMGAAKKGYIRRDFESYVEQLKYYPGPPRLFVWLNGFRVIKPPQRLPQGLRMVRYMLDELHKPYGHVFDAFSYDAGFGIRVLGFIFLHL